MGANSRDRGRGLTHRVRKPSVCPRCGKKGLGQWSARAAAVTGRPISSRDCRYCSYGETWHHPTERVTNTLGEIVKPGAIQIRGKLGTHPSDTFSVKARENDDPEGALIDLEGPPSEGDCVWVRSQCDARALQYVEVIVYEIKDMPHEQFFYLGLR